MSKLNVGIIGVGRMGALHARNIANRVPHATLAAVADMNIERARRLAEELEVPKVSDDYRALLDDDTIDAVVEVGASQGREERVLAAIDAGKHMFCEKPLALDPERIAEIKRRLEGAPIQFQLGFMRRFDPGYAHAKERIAAGDIGIPISIRCVSRDPYLPPIEYIPVSGGIFADQAVHDFDLSRWLMGEEVGRVYATGGVYVYDEIRPYDDIDNGVATLHYESGKFGTVEVSRNAVYGYDIRTEIFGSEGALSVGYFRERPVLLLSKAGVSHDFVPYFFERFADAYLAEMEHFIDCLVTGKNPSVGVVDAERSLAIAVAATESLKAGRPVDVRIDGRGIRTDAADRRRQNTRARGAETA